MGRWGTIEIGRRGRRTKNRRNKGWVREGGGVPKVTGDKVEGGGQILNVSNRRTGAKQVLQVL